MIRVLILASSPAARAGLDKIVRSNPFFQAIGHPLDDVRSTEALVGGLRPDVVLAELESRDDGNTLALLEEAAKGTAVMLLVHGSLTHWRDAMEFGVRGLLPVGASAAQVSAAIEAAVAGLSVSYPNEAGPRPGGTNGSREAPPESLTPREAEVLRLLAEGLGNKEIASRLGISEHTVKFHVASVMGKLGAGTRTEAVTLGIRRGLVLI